MHSRGRLYAFDVSDKRLANLRLRLKRSGLSNVFPQRIKGSSDSHIKRLRGKVDRVLVDAPCSGLGTLRRNPDLKWRQTEADIAEMVIKQRDILDAAATLLKPGGRLVYATCSLLKEENEAVVETFLNRHSEFRLGSANDILHGQGVTLDTGVYLRLRPDLHGTDGFFAAVMEREKTTHA
jgi:16S rRNA (cytosine967-C5)-methyltransferase